MQVVCLLSLIIAGASTPPVTLTDVGVAAGIHELTAAGIPPAWLALDGDNHPDPLWFSYEGSRQEDV